MTLLEEWCFSNILFSFGSLVSYVIVLIHMEVYKKKFNVKPKLMEGNDEGSKRSVNIEAACFVAVFVTYIVYTVQVHRRDIYLSLQNIFFSVHLEPCVCITAYCINV